MGYQMTEAPLSSSAQDTPLDVLWQDGERLYRRIWRDMDDGGRREFLAAQPCAEHPTPGTVSRLAHEYGLKDYLDHPWALRPLELVRERGQTMLVFESTTARPLDKMIGPGLPVGTFLRLAIAVTNAVAHLHQCGLVHQGHQRPATSSSIRKPVTPASPVSASLHGFRASARADRPSSSQERCPTWRRSRPGG